MARAIRAGATETIMADFIEVARVNEQIHVRGLKTSPSTYEHTQSYY